MSLSCNFSPKMSLFCNLSPTTSQLVHKSKLVRIFFKVLRILQHQTLTYTFQHTSGKHSFDFQIWRGGNMREGGLFLSWSNCISNTRFLLVRADFPISWCMLFVSMVDILSVVRDRSQWTRGVVIFRFLFGFSCFPPSAPPATEIGLKLLLRNRNKLEYKCYRPTYEANRNTKSPPFDIKLHGLSELVQELHDDKLEYDFNDDDAHKKIIL